ncbi:MAG: ABC transporter substrate-binding protein [Deltaproteobacteria bacterium]|nr:ABC transporter substrate-binding protein [Deltaproteobacteria bacterium]
MKQVLSLFLIIAISASGTTPAAGQDPPKTPVIGYLAAGSGADHLRKELLLGLEQLGFVVGKNIRIEYRAAKGKRDRLPELIAELVQLKVDIIVPTGPTAIGPILKATKTIPIVMPNAGSDPVGAGFVKSLSEPGGNATGIAIGVPGLGSKKLELLKEALPSIRSVIFMNPHDRPHFLKEYNETAKTLGLKFDVVNVRSDGDIDEFFATVAMSRPDALIIERDSLTLRNAGKIGDLVLKHRIPTMNNQRIFVEKGGLMSYGVSYPANWRRSAVYVDKILKGANPATLPVEPPQLELVINLKTAEKIGVNIPPEILLEANEVIQ